MRNKGFYFPAAIYSIMLEDFVPIRSCVIFARIISGRYYYQVFIGVEMPSGTILKATFFSDTKETPTKNDAIYYLRKLSGAKNILM